MKTYIINVSTNSIRREHMLKQISKNDCLKDCFFVHEGDLEMLTADVLRDYFFGELNTPSPVVSCAYKHILAYMEVAKSEDEIALVLEDDIYLDSNFCMGLQKILLEIRAKEMQNFIISLEDSNLQYVKGSELKKDTTLYKKSSGRMAGAYLIDKKCAQKLKVEVQQNRCNLPIDWFHNLCLEKGIINIYWAHPTLATQGSLNGKIKSLIDKKKFGHMRALVFRLSRRYKKMLYMLR